VGGSRLVLAAHQRDDGQVCLVEQPPCYLGAQETGCATQEDAAM
jgi:hypothetical protein